MAVMALEEAPAVIGETVAGGEGSTAASSRAASSIRGDTPGAAKRRRAVARLGGPAPRGSSRSSGGARSSRQKPRSLLVPKKGRTWAQAFESMSGKTNGAPLLAEYIGGVIIICLGTLTQGPSKGYANAMSELLLRLTALTTVFFVLFLLAGTKAGKAAVWFGLLIDLGIVFTAAQHNVLSDTATLISSSTVSGGTATLTSAGGGNLEQPEPPPAVTLPAGVPEGTGTATA